MDLGLETAEWTCVGQIEIDPYCQRVLQKWWPDVPKWTDVREMTDAELRGRCGRIDAVVGGPPCQPASHAGKRQGSADARWLWPEFLGLVRTLTPRVVLAENPPGLATLTPHGLEWVCTQLEAAGYEVLVTRVGAWTVGAPHKRERLWIMGHANSKGLEGRGVSGCERADDRTTWPPSSPAGLAHSDSGGRHEKSRTGSTTQSARRTKSDRQAALAHSDSARQQQQQWSGGLLDDERTSRGHDADRRHRWPSRPGEPQHAFEPPRTVERRLGRDTLRPARGMDPRRQRLTALGNACVVPIVTEIGRAILEAIDA